MKQVDVIVIGAGAAGLMCALTAGQSQGSDVIQLFAQLAFVNQLCQTDGLCPVDQGKRDMRVWVITEHRLTHQQLVKVSVNQRPDDRVDLPFVVPDPRGDIGHIQFPLSALTC